MDALTPLGLADLQNGFIEALSAAFFSMGAYATRLFYLLATIELAWFGLIWAMRQDQHVGHLVIKIFKLSLVFTVIAYFPQIVQILLDGFTQTAFGQVPTDTADYLFNPAKLWTFGFDASISLLQLAVATGSLNVAASQLYITLGLGTLLCFALMGVQVLYILASYYFTALVSLLLMPFGALTSFRRFIEKPLEQLMIQGVRLFTTILILGIGIQFWQGFDLQVFDDSTTIDKPLGLLFSALAILILMWRLPNTVGDAVGHIITEHGSESHTPTTSTQAATSVNVQAPYASSALQAQAAATQVTTGHAASSLSPQSIQTTGASTSSHYGMQTAGAALTAGQADSISRSISEKTVKQLKKKTKNEGAAK